MYLIPPPQPEYWVLSLSGGKDSTALGLEWLKRHQQDPVTYPLHEVIYCDTGMEFPAMVEHINRLEQIFTGAGIKFTRLKSEKSFEYLMFEYQPKKKNPELQHLKGKSWPTSKVRWCTGELKQKIVSRYFKQLRKQKTVIQLVALAADEKYRLERKNNQDPIRLILIIPKANWKPVFWKVRSCSIWWMKRLWFWRILPGMLRILKLI